MNDENYVKESLKWLKAVDFNPWSVPKEIIQKYLSPMEMFCFCEIDPNETEISNYLNDNPLPINEHGFLSGRHRVAAMIGRILRGEKYIPFNVYKT